MPTALTNPESLGCDLEGNRPVPSRSYPKLSENVYIWHFYH